MEIEEERVTPRDAEPEKKAQRGSRSVGETGWHWQALVVIFYVRGNDRQISGPSILDRAIVEFSMAGETHNAPRKKTAAVEPRPSAAACLAPFFGRACRRG